MRKKCLIGILLLMLCAHFSSLAQLPLLQQQLLQLTNHSDSVINNLPPEKIYIQFDRPEYTVGDTIWFKVYVLNGASHLLSSRSGLLHIDIGTDSSRVVKQYLFAVYDGLSPGNITLDQKQFKAGNYTIRAYAQWMRNFSDDGFYFKHIRIVEAGENAWLVNNRIDTSNNGTHIRARMLISRLDNTPMGDSVYQAEVLNGKRTLYKQKVQADKDGLVDVSFNLPPGAKPSVILENTAKNKRAVVPLMLNRPQNTDVQFMPEGGSLVAGFDNKIGFKAIGEDGRGVDISGVIVDRQERQVAAFKSLYKGIGSFNLRPEEGGLYTARVTLADGLVKNYPLPQSISGTELQVENVMHNDSVGVTISASPDLAQSNNSFFLLGKSRGVVCYAAVVSFRNQDVIRRTIAKSPFPTGIAHFILMTPDGRPLNERLVYIDHRDELHISVEPNKYFYAPKDSIALHLKVTDSTGVPIKGNFSMAVTDDTQVKTDSLTDDNILNHLLLTSDLKGYIETPGYYFKQDQQAWQALDNLLLTQGWVSYEPLTVAVSYLTEKEYTMTGSVNNLFNSPVKKTDVLLFSSHPSILLDTLTDDKGRFIFNRFPRVDTPVFVLQARNRHGRSFNVNIKVAEMAPPVFTAPPIPALTPWYVNIDTTTAARLKDNIATNKLEYISGITGHHLKEVKIIGQKTVKGSENLNGPGNADIVLDEKDVEAAGKKSWLQMLQENISGFHEGYLCIGAIGKCKDDAILLNFIIDNTGDKMSQMSQPWYFINDKPVKIIIDGVSLFKVVPIGNEPMVFNEFSDFLKSHNAEDIKGMEINSSTKYTYRYVPMEWSEQVRPNDVAFIEITTRSGHGAVLKNTPGTYLYKPLALSWPKQFYKPRYPVNDTSRTVDLRPTIDWEPNIVTDADGKATISFFAGTKPTSYTILIDGVDGNGNVGSQRKKIIVKGQGAKAASK